MSAISTITVTSSSYKPQGATISSISSGSTRAGGTTGGAAVYVPSQPTTSSGTYKRAGATLSSLNTQSSATTTKKAGATLQQVVGSKTSLKSQGATISSTSSTTAKSAGTTINCKTC